MGRQFALDHTPETNNINRVIFVPQPVSEAPDIPPLNLGAKFGSQHPQLYRSLADDEQRVFDRVDTLFVFAERLKVQAGRETFDAGYIVQDVLKALYRIARRHARDPVRREPEIEVSSG